MCEALFKPMKGLWLCATSHRHKDNYHGGARVPSGHGRNENQTLFSSPADLLVCRLVWAAARDVRQQKPEGLVEDVKIRMVHTHTHTHPHTHTHTQRLVAMTSGRSLAENVKTDLQTRDLRPRNGLCTWKLFAYNRTVDLPPNESMRLFRSQGSNSTVSSASHCP